MKLYIYVFTRTTFLNKDSTPTYNNTRSNAKSGKFSNSLIFTSNKISKLEYYQDNIASWQFIQHVIAENKDGKVLKKVFTLPCHILLSYLN
jgi:hypothetical protein